LSSGGKSILTTTQAHTGLDSALLCGYNSCNDQIWQVVKLPATFTSVKMSYWYLVTSSETSAKACNDTLYSRLRTTATSPKVITTAQQLCNYDKTSRWVQKTVDVTKSLSSYKGQSIQVYFQGTSNATLTTSFYLDDITLTVT
jgi:hypothetical protein